MALSQIREQYKVIKQKIEAKPDPRRADSPDRQEVSSAKAVEAKKMD